PDQAIPHARALSLRDGDRGVCHTRRVLGERFDRAERLGEGEYLEPLQRAKRGWLVLDLEAHHATEHAHLPRSDAAVRVRVEAGIEDTLDSSGALARRRELYCVSALALH